MRHGFKRIALDLIRADPGRSAEHYAKVALDRGLSSSDSKDPVFSLASSLRKQAREGRTPEIKTARVNGRICFFPVNHVPNEREKTDDSTITLIVSAEHTQIVDSLVEVGRFANRSQAAMWLLEEGMKARDTDLQRVQRVLEQIWNLKQSVLRT